MLVEPDTVEPQLVHQAPSVQVLLIILDGNVGSEVLLGEREGQLTVLFEVVQVFRVGQKVETENLHTCRPPKLMRGTNPTYRPPVAGNGVSSN